MKHNNPNYFLNAKSPSYKQMLNLCEKVAKSNVNVLLIGESGSGKEIAAQYIHSMSKRNSEKMVTINCSSVPNNLLESELFGHVEGSFTGATKNKEGKIETAENSTLFLDEIGDISLMTQVKLLRTLENKRITPVGSTKDRPVNFRLISATNIDFSEAIQQGKIREDFFYRISTIVIRVPPLRERLEDFDDMLNFFVRISEKEHDITIKGIVPKVKKFIYDYDYPGNIRELKNLVDRMVVLSEDGIITEQCIPILYSISAQGNTSKNISNEYEKIISLKSFRKQQESEYIKFVLEKYNGHIDKTANALEISSRQLFNKIKEYNLRQ